MERIKSESEYNIFDWWKKVFIHNYSNFSGRARRSEYWYFLLANVLIVIFLHLFSYLPLLWMELAILSTITSILTIFYIIAIIIPGIAVAVRRLHDTNKSGLFILITLIPFLGRLILIIFYCLEGDKGPNQYGPDPKENIDLISN